MRKFAIALAPATLALVVLMACEDTTNPAGIDLVLDSGGGGFDANTPPFDGATPSDASVPDAPPANPTVRVTVTGQAGAKAGVDVVFHSATGAVLEAKQTGADGTATHMGADAVMVTALLATGNHRDLVTWTGVEVGDDLKLRDWNDGSYDDVGEYNVTLLSDFADAGASRYNVDGPCGGSFTYGTGAVLSLRSDCSRAKNAVRVEAQDGNFNLVGYAFKKGNDGITDGGTAQVNIDGWKAPATLTLNVANVPASTYVPSQLFEIADGAGFLNFTSSTTDEFATINYKIADGFADAYQASIGAGSNRSNRTITKHVPTAAAIDFDYATFLPAITDATIDVTDPRRAVLSWTSDSMAAAKGGLAQFHFDGPDDANYSWTIVVPPGATTVTAPEIPAALESFLPYAADSGMQSSVSDPELLFVDATIIPNYAVFRREQGTLLQYGGGSIGTYSFPAVPFDGTYKTSGYGQMPE